ncbi:MAG: YvcK family protein [Patescibacteria group bacterium]|nr:YvcK family protein [Patescibacteria group bacterium]
MKNVVTIAGGNGSAISITALKRFIPDISLSSIVCMSDSGSSSGRLRKELGVYPPGDMLRAVLAMSPYDYNLLKDIFNKTRFENVGKLDKHSLGNIFLSLSEKYSSFMDGVEALKQAVKAVGEVYPTTLEKNNLVAELENGEIIFGEGNICEPSYDRNIKIKKVWLEKENEKESPIIYSAAKVALEKADYIFLGPGDLYTSIIATILPEGFKEVLQKTSAKLVYIFGNAIHSGGETGPTKFSEAVFTLEKYVGRKFDIVVYDNHTLNNEELANYKERGWKLIEYDKENLVDHNILEIDYEKVGGGLCSDKLSVSLKEIMDL